MSRLLGTCRKNEEICTCNHCNTVFAYTNDEVKTERKYEVDYWGGEHWERQYVTCPNCKKDIKWSWH